MCTAFDASVLAKKGLSVGDLVCGQLVGVTAGGIFWKILLPAGARGLLHVTCMPRQQRQQHQQSTNSHLPKKGTWLTCRLIDQPDCIEDDEFNNSDSDVDDASSGDDEEKGEEGPVAKGDEIVPVGDVDKDMKTPPSKVFFVSTILSDMYVPACSKRWIEFLCLLLSQTFLVTPAL